MTASLYAISHCSAIVITRTDEVQKQSTNMYRNCDYISEHSWAPNQGRIVLFCGYQNFSWIPITFFLLIFIFTKIRKINHCFLLPLIAFILNMFFVSITIALYAEWKVTLYIGVGTFLKVRGNAPMGTAANFWGRNLTYPQNQFSPRILATLFSRKCQRCF